MDNFIETRECALIKIKIEADIFEWVLCTRVYLKLFSRNPTTPGGRYNCFYSPMRLKEWKWLKSIVSKWWRWDLNSCLPDTETRALTSYIILRVHVRWHISGTDTITNAITNRNKIKTCFISLEYWAEINTVSLVGQKMTCSRTGLERTDFLGGLKKNMKVINDQSSSSLEERINHLSQKENERRNSTMA